MANQRSTGGPDPFFDQGLPESIQAERLILGAILLDNSVCAQAVDLLKRQDFFLDSHRRIFEKMVVLGQKQWPIDLVTLSEALRVTGEFEQIGGATYIASLIDGVPRTDKIENYAQIVIQKALARALINVSAQITSMCFDDADRDDLATEAQRLIFKACEERQSVPWVQLGNAAAQYLNQVDEIGQRNEAEGLTGLTGLVTDLRDLDYKLLGLQRQELIVLAGRPSQGKTSLAFDLTKRVAEGKSRAKCAFLSLEMGTMRIGEKGIASGAHLNSWRMRSGMMNREEWAGAVYIKDELLKLGVWVCDEARLGTTQMRAKLQRLRNDEGPIDLIVADYLKLFTLPKKRDLRQELGDATAEMKNLAKEFNASVILLHQLNRETTKGTNPEPELQHLAESGDIEAHADVVLFIYTKDGPMLKIAKNRNGPTGKFPLVYFKEQHRFENADTRSDRYNPSDD